MIAALDHTHNSSATSWLESANMADNPFPIQNLPWCVFRSATHRQPTIGIGIGDQILDARRLAASACLSRLDNFPLEAALSSVLTQETLNAAMCLTPAQRKQLRFALFELLSDTCPVLRDDAGLRSECLFPISSVQFHLPAWIGDYTDFYASIYHATNVGCMLRPDNPLLPNYRWIPIGYHGRSSSIVTSGTPIRRPHGQVTPSPETAAPNFRPSNMLDYELEVAIWIGGSNPLGETIHISEAEQYWFGLGLLNDWSARDIQRWEYQPLGPFLAKNFATTISPWIVTAEALAPFRTPALVRGPDDPPPLPHLDSQENRNSGGIQLSLEVWLRTSQMRESGELPIRLSTGSFRDLYWTVAQLITHHASNGCNLRPGDVLGSGTVSGKRRTERGCLLELTWDGEFGQPVPGTQRTPLSLPDGEERLFLQDGDEIILTGYCTANGFCTIGFGECAGSILPAEG